MEPGARTESHAEAIPGRDIPDMLTLVDRAERPMNCDGSTDYFPRNLVDIYSRGLRIHGPSSARPLCSLRLCGEFLREP